MCGLPEAGGPNRGMYLKKPSTMTASCWELVWPFRNKKCIGRHQHLALFGQGPSLNAAQVWTWDEAQRVAEGIRLVMHAIRVGHSVVPVYPHVDAGHTGRSRNTR